MVPARLFHIEPLLRADGRRADRDPKVAERIVPMGLDIQRQLLPAQRRPLNIANSA
jgi:hypothetical protein